MTEIDSQRRIEELERQLAEANMEIERWRKVDKRCQTYWLAEDPEYGGEYWDVIVESCDLRHGDVVEVWRGGTVEVAWCGFVGDAFIKEPTREAAEAKAKELLATFNEEEDA